MAAEQRLVKQREAASALRQSLARFGAVRENERGLMLVLPETVWAGARLTELSPKGTTTIDPLAALLANNPDFRVVIEVHTDNRGDEAELRKLTQDRADALAGRLVSAGVDGARIQASGMGAGNPVASNPKPSGRTRNRRTEIMLVPVPVTDGSTTAERSEN
ncbi:MAG: OmpA family protein [Chloroflexia bacterium]